MKRIPFPASILLFLTLASPCFSQWESWKILKTAVDSDIVPAGDWNNRAIATDTIGTIHVVWDQRGGGMDWIFYQRSTDWGATWEPPVFVSQPGVNAGNPSVAADGSGNVHVVWVTWYTPWMGLVYRRSTDRGQTWQAETLLVDASTYGSLAGDEDVIADEKGNVHLIWSQGMTPSSISEVAYKRSSDGGLTWSPDTFLTNTQVMHTNEAIALDNQGGLHISWYEYPSLSSGQVWYRDTKDDGITWRPPVLIADNDSTLPGGPNVAVDGLNRVYVFFTAYWWTDTIEQREIVYRVSVDTGKTFGPRQAMTLYPRIPFRPASVTGDIFGGVHAVWPDQWGDAILYNGSTNGGKTWRYDPPLAIYDSLYEWWPSITSDSRGKVHLIAEGFGSTNLYYGVYRNGYPLGVEENRQGDKETRGQGFKITPNPFVSFARIPGHGTERFALYDITGRRVGTYRGDRIGEGLAAGVYFIREVPPTQTLPLKGGGSKLLRIVKIR